MSRHDALLGALPLLILKILGQRGPMHGYALTTHIETTSEDVLRVMEGSLYPALHRMEEAGWIRARWATTGRQRRVRIYAITANGFGRGLRMSWPFFWNRASAYSATCSGVSR